jgi:hypothetical protein
MTPSTPPMPGSAGGSATRLLADSWVATLDDHPFRPTPAQLAWVAAADPVGVEAHERCAPLAAARHVGLFADHVAQDVTGEGGPAAYVRVWLCARRAFIDSVTAPALEPACEQRTQVWENEGGTVA